MRDRQPHVGGDQPVQRLFVALVAPGIGQPQLGFGIQKFRLHRIIGDYAYSSWSLRGWLLSNASGSRST
jgi:hypothetical protein